MGKPPQKQAIEALKFKTMQKLLHENAEKVQFECLIVAKLRHLACVLRDNILKCKLHGEFPN